MKRARLPLVALPLSVLAACGRGGGGDEAKGAYVAAAAGVCASAQKDSAALTRPTKPTDLAPAANSTVAIAKRAQEALAALTPPPEDAAELRTRVLDPFAALVTRGQAYAAQVTAAGTDQAKLLPLLGQQPTAQGVDLDFLRSYGLGVCADLLDAR